MIMIIIQRIKNLGIQDFILFNLFLFNIRDGYFSFVMTLFKTMDCLQELSIAPGQQGCIWEIVIDTVMVFL